MSWQPGINTSKAGLTVNRYISHRERSGICIFLFAPPQCQPRKALFVKTWKAVNVLPILETCTTAGLAEVQFFPSSLVPPPAQPGLKQLIDVNRCNSCDFASFYASNLVNHIRVSQLSNMKLVAYSFEQSTRSPCSPLSF